jgi:16S rRNA (guanine(966)-N(2))-methyltransferase RsmD
VRVVAGKYKRRPLATPAGTDVTRPTSDRAKESLFNILQGELKGACVLDLFSGSGALGIEALSRGAGRVLFVENHPEALFCLRSNLSQLGISSCQARIIQADVSVFLRPEGRKSLPGWREEEFAASADLIIADPPYASPWYDQAVESIEESGLCGSEALLVLEMSSKRPPGVDSVSRWNRVDERTYGAARIEFWKRDSREEPDGEGNSEIS